MYLIVLKTDKRHTHILFHTDTHIHSQAFLHLNILQGNERESFQKNTRVYVYVCMWICRVKCVCVHLLFYYYACRNSFVFSMSTDSLSRTPQDVERYAHTHTLARNTCCRTCMLFRSKFHYL